MQSISIRSAFIFIVVIAIGFLTACGGGSSAPEQKGPPPVFGTNPVLTAAEGQTYTYKMRASDWAGAVVTFSLTQGPAGAKLDNDTITWVPTADQARKPNNFAVVATTALGGKASQAWTVEPTGIVHISWVDTYWDENGATAVPFDMSRVAGFIAVVVQKNGTWQTLSGTAGTTGTFDIPGVPSGYYWLRVSPRGQFWTNVSNFDFGGDYVQSQTLATTNSSSTTFNFNFSGLENAPGSMVDVLTPVFGFSGTTTDGLDTFSRTMTIGGNVDYSKVKTAYVMQYKPTSFGSMTGKVLGPALTLSNPGWVSGASNNVTGTLMPSPTSSVNLSIKGSGWASLFDRVAPGTVTPVGTAFEVEVQPYLNLSGRFDPNGTGLTLLAPDNVSSSGTGGWTPLGVLLRAATCQAHASQTGLLSSLPPVLLSDQDFGTVQYGDPYPAAWQRVFSICQQASIDLAIPGVTDPVSYTVTNGQSVVKPTAAVAPMISAVQNPKINDADFFTAGTVIPSGVTLSWSKPAIGNPTAYSVQLLGPTTTPSGTVSYVSTATLWATGTSVTLPPDLLVSGKTYVFVITALSDAHANVETSPNRHSLPIANADVVSAPMTVQ